MKSNAIAGFVTLVVFIGGLLFAMSAFVVHEGEQVVVTRWGKIDRTISTAGLNFKVPFMDELNSLEKRILEFDGDPEQTQTNDKKPISIDTFARWRIKDAGRFFETVRTEAAAQSRLSIIIDSATRKTIASHILVEAVRNSDRPLTQDKEIVEARQTTLPEGVVSTESDVVTLDADVAIEVGREGIVTKIRQSATAELEQYGIELVDVKIKRINYGAKVQAAVHERMRSDREQIGQKYRSEGLEQHAIWEGRMLQDQNEILSAAYKDAETIRGEAEAEAAKIYAEAYGEDPEFYAFWKTLEIYRESLRNNTTLVISTDAELFRYLRKAGLVPSVSMEGGGR